MKKLLVLAVCVATAVLATSASAGNASGHVTRVTTYGNAVIFAVESTPSPAPCSTAGDFVVDASTSEGKAMYANVLTALAVNRPISVFSANSCPSWWSNSETPNSVTITQ